MYDAERCCGAGTCIIDAQGHCWCGQQWDGVKMCRPEETEPTVLKTPDLVQPPPPTANTP